MVTCGSHLALAELEQQEKYLFLMVTTLGTFTNMLMVPVQVIDVDSKADIHTLFVQTNSTKTPITSEQVLSTTTMPATKKHRMLLHCVKNLIYLL